MKKITLCIIALIVTLTFSSCRKDETELYDPLNIQSFDTPSEQFESLWRAMATNYVMWDIDPTDWNAVHDEYYPKFLKLDEKWERYDNDESTEAISTDELAELYVSAFANLIDHHFSLRVYNYWGESEETTEYFNFSPGNQEIKQRDYYHDAYILAYKAYSSSTSLEEIDDKIENTSIVQHLRKLETEGRASQIMYGSTSDMCVISALIDGKTPYLYFSTFDISNLLNNSNIWVDGTAEAQTYQAFNNFYKNILTEDENSIDGVIIDLRENNGGILLDHRFLLGALVDQPIQAGWARYKAGLGMYDYSAWTPHIFYPGPYYRIGFSKPIVVISDINSVSMAEITTMMTKELPNGYVVGERTYGGHGVLSSETYALYSGTFGSKEGPYYGYLSDHLVKTLDGEILEGIGISPDINMTFKKEDLTGGNDTWMDRAITVVKTGM
jgi:hypothetical protein